MNSWIAFGALPLIAFIAGAAKGATGFGGALIMAPVLTLFMPGADVAILVVLVHTVTGFQGVRDWGRLVRWPRILSVAVIAVLTTWLAGHLIDARNAGFFRHMTGVAVLIITVLHMSGWRWRHSGGVTPTLLTGFISGILTAIAGLGGPPAVYYFSGLSKHTDSGTLTRANLLAYFMVLFSGTTLLLTVQHKIEMHHLRSTLVLAPAFMLGALAGAKAYRHLPGKGFNRVVTVLLFTSGVLAIVS